MTRTRKSFGFSIARKSGMATIVFWPPGMAAMAGFVPRLPKIIWHIHQLPVVRFMVLNALTLSPPAP
jgi:hypothetical protein